jgi:hypothetical protein
MTRKDAFTKIKELLGLEPQMFEQAKTAEGVVVVWDGELATGTPLFVIDEAGTQQAAPDGEHTLEDGTMITTAGGLVVTVAPKEQEKETEIEIEMATELEMLVEKLAAKVAELETKMEEMSMKPEAMSTEEVEAKLSAITETVESKFTAIKEVVESIAAEPAAEPAQPIKTNFSKSMNSIDELYKNIQKIK